MSAKRFDGYLQIQAGSMWFRGMLVMGAMIVLAAVTLGSARVAAQSESSIPGSDIGVTRHTAVLSHTLYLPLTIRQHPVIQGHGILFKSDRAEAGKYDIYRMDLDGNNVQRLTHLAIDDATHFAGQLMGRWSPDGTRIAVQIKGALYLLQPDGSALSPLVDDPLLQVEGMPAWSPDGTQIAFIVRQCVTPQCMSFTDDGSGLRVVDVQTDQVSLLRDDVFLSYPSGVHWTPDGLSILSVPDSDSGVYVDRLDDLSQTTILNDRFVAGLDVAANGQKLAFTRSNAVFAYTADIDGSDRQTIYDGLTDGGLVSRPVWHPNSQQVAYIEATNTGYDQTIFATAPDGSDKVELTSFDNETRKWILGWTPDGTQFLYMSDRDRNYRSFDVYIVGADGSNPVNLTPNSPANDVASDYHP